VFTYQQFLIGQDGIPLGFILLYFIVRILRNG